MANKNNLTLKYRPKPRTIKGGSKNRLRKSKHYRIKRKSKHYRKKQKSNAQLPIVYGKIHMMSCGHCINLIPEWNIVNEKMRIHSEVVCYDIERNEEVDKLPKFNEIYKPYENIQIQGGYPTIYKLHKTGGVINYYKGPRDNVSMLNWLHENK